ncbi:Cse1-domain-containing protein [Catenaria anguillulae PL171]|uniref:Cse1-domain-containing protein n=1 Tax=Catenaria anguillulae PL171 TaxID=765915 RepID=A0A1Y2HIU0_9FUNG|nr:Cse1-domain-containing protein [Catenaria anguillulae PL171]
MTDSSLADPRLVEIASILQRTLDPNLQRAATQELHDRETVPEFPQLLLQIIAAPTVEYTFRFAAVVFFKNLVKRNWEIVEGEQQKISLADRAAVKAAIVDIMIAVPTQLQLQLSEAVGIIASFDFPANWMELIDQLVNKLSPENYVINNGVLQTAHPIFKRWRSKYRTDDLFSEINFTIDRFCPAYLAIFQETDSRLTAAIASGDAANAKLYMQTMLLMAKIYYSFIIQDLPDFFDQHQSIYWPVFIKYLQPNLSPLLDSDSDEDPSDLDKMQTVVCEIANVFCDKYTEDWKYMGEVVQATWVLLTKTSTARKHDILVSRAMALLTTVVRRPAHRANFEAQDTLAAIVQQIVVPNLTLRESDEDMFEDEPFDFVRADLEGSDADTRRRSAADLVKGLLDQFEVPVRTLCVQWIDSIMAQSAKAGSAKEATRAKDAAVALFMAVATKSQLSSTGVSATDLDAVDFFVKHLLADLQTEQGLLTVAALKYVHMFRQQLTKQQHMEAMPLIARHLTSPSNAVLTWAAVVLDVQLTQIFKPAAGEVAASTLAEIAKHLGAVIMRESTAQLVQEHDRVLRTLLRCLQHGYGDVQAVMTVVMHGLNLAVTNPANPKFHHNAFECISMLVRQVCSGGPRTPANPAAVSQFESFLLPVFQPLITNDVEEFMPYAFQILAQTLSYHAPGAGLPEAYETLLSMLLMPKLWDAQGSVPALVGLVQQYLSKAAAQLVQRNQLQPILGIFQKLLSSRATDAFAFDLLQAIVFHVDASAMSAFRKPLFTMLLTRLSAPGSPANKLKFSLAFTQFLGFYFACAQPSPDVVIDAFNQVQPGVFTQIMTHVVYKNMSHMLGRIPRRIVCIGFTRMLAESSQVPGDLVQPSLVEIIRFAAHLQADVNKSGASAIEAGAEVDMQEADLDELAYKAGYSKLAAAGEKALDPVPQLAGVSGGKYLMTRWPEVAAKYPQQAAAVQATNASDMEVLKQAVEQGLA